MPKKTMLSWSSGKDSAWTLYQLQQDPAIELTGLFTTINQSFERVAMHAVRVELLKQQAEVVDLPLTIIELPFPCSNEQYATIMADFVTEAKAAGTACFAFGDLFLEDIRQYRIDQLADTGIEPIFPIWGIPTEELSQTMVESGLRAVITCVDPKQTPVEFAGRIYDQTLLDELPAGLDPCGENGEFHSFAFQGPMFQQDIPIAIGEVVERDGFVFADVLPAESLT